ncbi:ABC transporter permease [Marinomonas balearica]|uniref:Peptide/nickel transport system permease protein n=1 Tax=Marinomonas balearica TaxID=491947 RepID=A0A4V3CGD2_9GAMM|nr:ABC transporter permease [Marinomonas balearica]TDO97312.1 peptide/nickel transport system permease protein [Marinomonas balearica]
MKDLLFKRFIQLIMVAWGVGTLTFILMRSLPGDMAYRLAASRYGQDNFDSSTAELIRHELKLDQSAWSAYFSWLGDLLQLNLGNSMVSDLPVMDTLSHMLGHSLLLAGVGMIIAILLAFPLGLWAAKYGGWADRLTLLFSTSVRALPVFVIGVLLILVFSLELELLPVAGFGTPAHLILPSLALAISLAAVSSRIIRNEAKRVFNSSFFEFAQIKGLSTRKAFQRHGWRNLLVPVIAFFAIQLITVVEGVVMIESLFSWPGIGHGLAHAIFARDIPIIQGAALLMGIMFVVLNTLVDIISYYLDPRIKQEFSE